MKGKAKSTNRKIIQRAQELYCEEGTLEIDEPVSESDLNKMISYDKTPQANGGVYVQTWAWVPYEDISDLC